MSSTNGDTTFPARQAIAVRNQLSSPFLRLPSEIRNRIYYFALDSHEIYFIPVDDYDDDKYKTRTLQCRPNHQQTWYLKPVTLLMAINLPLACSQIRCELGQFYPFTHNTFGASTALDLTTMLGDLTNGQSNWIEVVTTNYTYTSSRKWLERYLMLCVMRRLRLVVLRDEDGMNEELRERTIRNFQEGIGRDGVKIEIVDISETA
jgi:hypothetical protein